MNKREADVLKRGSDVPKCCSTDLPGRLKPRRSSLDRQLSAVEKGKTGNKKKTLVAEVASGESSAESTL